MEITEEDIVSFRLECCLYRGDFNLEEAEEILKSGHDIHRVCFGGSILKMLLAYSYGENTIKALELILKYGAGEKINEEKNRCMDNTIFYFRDQPKILEILLEKGLNPNTIIRGASALELVIVFEQWEQVKLLLDFGADIELIVNETVKEIFFQNHKIEGLNVKRAIKVE